MRNQFLRIVIGKLRAEANVKNFSLPKMAQFGGFKFSKFPHKVIENWKNWANRFLRIVFSQIAQIYANFFANQFGLIYANFVIQANYIAKKAHA